MLLPRYLGLIWNFAFQKFTFRTDAMQIVAASAVPALAPYLGIENPTQVSSEVLAYIGMAAIALIAIRLLCAPYFIWKADQATAEALRGEIAAPERKERVRLSEHRTGLRMELSGKLAKLITFTEMARSPEALAVAYQHRQSELPETITKIDEIISELSYDVVLRVSCINLKKLCLRLIRDINENKEGVDDGFERLWKQRKITFRILHREDEVHELVSLAEFENLIEEYGESVSPSDHAPEDANGGKRALDDLKKMVKEVGPEMHRMGRLVSVGGKLKRSRIDNV